MTKTETLKIMAMLKGAYPHAYKDRDVSEAAVNIWGVIFSEKPYDIVMAAVVAYIATDKSGFTPAPGQINKRIYELLYPGELSEQEAWGLVSSAISSAYPHDQAAFNSLPDDLKPLVGSQNQLVIWGHMDEGQVQSVVASNFQRSYRELRARRRDQLALPSVVNKALEGARVALLGEHSKQGGPV